MERFITIINQEILLSEYLRKLNFSIHRFNELLNQKKIRVNNQIIIKDLSLKNGDKLMIDLSIFQNKPQFPFIETSMNLHILYEDDYLMVVDKPNNMIIYPDVDNQNELTVAHLVKKYYNEKGLDNGIYHVHRLDRNTTGCLLYAKDVITLAALSKMMEEKQITRHYLALVDGHFKHKKGSIDKPIAKDRHNNKMVCTKTGKEAKTIYEVIKEYSNNTSLVKVNLLTGRTHQIRVHFAAINHPLVNDSLYNPAYQSGEYQLVSSDISFTHPITNEAIWITKKEKR